MDNQGNELRRKQRSSNSCDRERRLSALRAATVQQQAM